MKIPRGTGQNSRPSFFVVHDAELASQRNGSAAGRESFPGATSKKKKRHAKWPFCFSRMLPRIVSIPRAFFSAPQRNFLSFADELTDLL